MFPFPAEDEDHGLETIDSAHHDQGQLWDGGWVGGNGVDQITDIDHGHGHDQGRKEINHDNEPHRETTESAELGQEDKLHKIVNRGVDPATTLGQQNLPLIWNVGPALSIGRKGHLVIGEVLQHQCGQVSILA